MLFEVNLAVRKKRSEPSRVAPEGQSFIYCLIDPRTREVRYIGRTRNLQSRYYSHLKPYHMWPANKQRLDWMNELRAVGLRAVFGVLEIVSNEEAPFAEIRWYRVYLSAGAPLLNLRWTKPQQAYLAALNSL